MPYVEPNWLENELEAIFWPILSCKVMFSTSCPSLFSQWTQLLNFRSKNVFKRRVQAVHQSFKADLQPLPSRLPLHISVCNHVPVHQQSFQLLVICNIAIATTRIWWDQKIQNHNYERAKSNGSTIKQLLDKSKMFGQWLPYLILHDGRNPAVSWGLRRP